MLSSQFGRLRQLGRKEWLILYLQVRLEDRQLQNHLRLLHLYIVVGDQRVRRFVSHRQLHY